MWAGPLPPNPFSSFSRKAHRYATDVLSGKVLAGRKVKLACRRFLNDLANKETDWKYRFDEERANLVCEIVELFPHEKGELMGQPVRLGDWQCFIFCNLFGWLNRLTGFRRFREAFILVPRGNGKSPMAAWVSVIMAFFDGEGGAEVYNAATTKDQAMEVFRVVKGIVDLMPSLTERLGIVSATESLYQPSTRSRVKPVIGKAKDGKAPHGVTNDEYHEQPDDLLYESFKRGMNKRRQPLLFNISTAGDTVEGPCFRMQEMAENILEGRFANEWMFVVIYDVDPDVDWTTEAACIMANPNYGVSINPEIMLADLEVAKNDAFKQNGFRCKNQNHWAQRLTAWMNMQSWNLCVKEIRDEDFREHPCFLGSDLASTLDLASTVKLFVRPCEDGKAIYTAFTRAYLPEKRIDDPARQQLRAWELKGFLKATEGGAINYKLIENDTVEDIQNFFVRELCFDKAYADQYAQQVAERTGVTTTVITPSPVELSPAMKELEAAVEDGRFEHDGNPVMNWCMGNVQVRMNQATGNYHIPTKDEPDKKIDCAIALLIAMARARYCLLDGNGGFIDPEDYRW